jgi:uncharacterized protein YigE (DUF2233 family)
VSVSLAGLAVGLWLAPVASPAWSTPAKGVDTAEMDARPRSEIGDSKVTVVRIDPAAHEIRLLSAKLLGLDHTLTAPEWAQKYGVLGVINASMYQQDHATSVAYMKAGGKELNGRWTKDNAVFAADPVDPSLPPVTIVDRTCAEPAGFETRYRILVQNIRMLDCKGRNTWSPQPRRWSTAAVGMDAGGRILFIHCRSPYSTHDFIDILRALPLELARLMYVEGGPEASLYVAVDGKEIVSRIGSFETGFRELDDNDRFWPIPNVLGFAPKK